MNAELSSGVETRTSKQTRAKTAQVEVLILSTTGQLEAERLRKLSSYKRVKRLKKV